MPKGVTLLELTVVILVLMTLIGMSAFAITGYKKWKLGTEAGIELRRVYNAQREFLAENPTLTAANITLANVLAHHSSTGITALPTPEGVDGTALTIDFTVMPPVLTSGGSTYDPSGDPNDGLWDVGGL